MVVIETKSSTLSHSCVWKEFLYVTFLFNFKFINEEVLDVLNLSTATRRRRNAVKSFGETGLVLIHTFTLLLLIANKRRT